MRKTRKKTISDIIAEMSGGNTDTTQASSPPKKQTYESPDPGKPQREIITQEQMYHLAKKIKDHEAQLQYYLMALTAQRVGEALATRIQDITIIEQEGQEFLQVFSITEKNKHRPTRNIITPYQDPQDKPYINKIIDHTQEYKTGPFTPSYHYINKAQKSNNRKILFNRFRPLEFTIRAKHNNTIINDYPTWINPHYLRKCRLTWWCNKYNLDSIALQQLAGWTDDRPARHYLQVSTQRVAKQFL